MVMVEWGLIGEGGGGLNMDEMDDRKINGID